MYKFRFQLPLFVIVSVLFVSCSTSRNAVATADNITGLKYLSTYVIPFNFQYNNTTVGGLSGIDYDAKKNLYYMISDDRSDKNPARFYTAHIYISQKGIDSLQFTGVKSLLQSDGKVYPNNKQNRHLTPDPEAMRYNPQKNYLVWSSEGERIIKPKDTVLIDPSVIVINTDGAYIDSFILPANMHVSLTEKGPRQNGVFEGLAFADNFKTLYVSVEEPLYEDGPRADVVDNNAFIRIIKYNVANKKSTEQFAYKLEPVAYATKSPSDFKINGVSDILSLGNNKLLVIERSFSTGRLPCTIKVFTADLNGATDVSSVQLKGNTSFVPATKKLLLNMDDLGIYTDNIEGVTFGPLLPNGHKTLLFIVDNNFSILEKAQVLLFEVLE